MELITKEIIKQIDDILSFYEEIIDLYKSGKVIRNKHGPQAISRLNAAINRLAPPFSTYITDSQLIINKDTTHLSEKIDGLAGILETLKYDYEAGYFNKVSELIHAELFSDFLEMAEHLHQKGYIGPAAVLAGCVLEEHMRKLCVKNSIDIEKQTSKGPIYRHIEELNADLVKAGVYDKNVQKGITQWYGLRTSAAHGRTDEYSKEQIALMIQGIRDFISKYSA